MYHGTLHQTRISFWGDSYPFVRRGKTGVLPTEGQQWHFFRETDPEAEDVYLDGTVARVRVRGPRGKWRVFTMDDGRQYRFEIERED